MISEYGAGFSNKETDGTIRYAPVHDWWILKGVIGKLMQFISRPDTILKAIPFIITTAGWIKNPKPGYTYPFQLWDRASGSLKATYTHLVYALFQGVTGDYLDT